MYENKSLEFKEIITNTFLKTVSAFANYCDGKILFGVKNDGEIIGVNNPDDICLDIENKINDSIKPRPEFSFDINRRTNVVTLNIKEGYYKPYMYKSKAYKRSGSASVEVDQIEFKRLVLLGKNLYFEEILVENKKLEFTYLFLELKKKMGISNFNLDTLKTLGLYNNAYNNAALLLADENKFPGIDIIKFGTNINEILFRESIKNTSLIKQLNKAEEIFDRYYRIEVVDGMNRREKYLISKEAFRETVANALIHRVWDVNSNIRIAMYDDKIEVFSPGGLPIGITKEEYLKGYVSYPRNPIIANVFFRLNIVEMFGTGIKRIKNSYKENKQKPIFKVSENSIVIILPTIFNKLDLTLDEKIIMDNLSSNIHLASSQLSERTGFSKDKVVKLVNSLLSKDYIVKEGRGRGTKYYLS